MEDETNPWTTLSSRTVYDNPWIRVEEHEVVNPGGGRNRYGKVCFKNRAVAVIALDGDDNVYLVGQHRFTLGEYSWELPMGGAPLDEDPRDAAARELQEETGLSASHWRELMRLHPSNSVTDEVGLVYVAEGLTPGEQSPEETEALTVKALPLAEACRWTLDGRITDAISVAGLLRFAAERGLATTTERRLAAPAERRPAKRRLGAQAERGLAARAARRGRAPVESRSPEAPAEPELQAPAEPEPQTPAEPEPQTPAEPESQAPAESEPQTPAESELQAPAEPHAPAEPRSGSPAPRRKRSTRRGATRNGGGKRG